jgi:DNA polymerase-3 subunit epsilon
MAKIQLAADYYLHHFAEFLQVILSRYQPVLQAVHQQFIADYQQLPMDAKRLWLRMLNRKGSVFALSDLEYAEITAMPAAVAQLLADGFVVQPTSEEDFTDWLQRANKDRLYRLLQHSAVEVKKSESRPHLQALVMEHQLLTAPLLNAQEPYLAIRRTAELQYLLFLFFGRFEQNLQAFTLRDLGVMATGGLKAEFQARFQDAATASSAFFYAEAYAKWRNAAPSKGETRSIAELTRLRQQMPDWPEPLDDKTAQKQEQLLFECGLAAQRSGEMTLAEHFYQASGGFQAAERLVRLYQQRGQTELLLTKLAQMIDNPSCDDELWFARDLAARLGKERRVTDLTLLLQQATVLTLDELFLGQTEQGAVQYYQQGGQQAWHVENELWLSVFGLLFWQELFESEQSAIFNEFERRPRDLTSPEFYRKHQVALEAKLTQLSATPQQSLLLILQNFSRYYGTVNSIFRWHTEITSWLTPLFNLAPANAIAGLLRKMAQDFRHHASGYPDLLVVAGGELRFIELKAPGDSLRRHQLTRIRSMQALGFQVELQKVVWGIDPTRCYAVVDVETTGGTGEQDRITEIAIVKVQYGEIIASFSSLVNPLRQIPPFITRLTGIHQAMVATAPCFSDIAEQVLAQLEGCIFVAHNVKFDYGFVRAELQRAGFNLQRPQLCTVVESRRYFPGLKSYGLAALTAHFDIPLTTHHRALADATATAELLLLLNQQRAKVTQTAE